MNMTPFLKQVAEHYLSLDNLEKRCFIFPNRRSMVFFKKYLGEALVKPIVTPKMLTINDFFFTVSGKNQADRVTLLLELYDCYKALNSKAESLDEFIFWGDTLLADFNDVDKYLVNPEQLFTNIADLKKIQDNFSYLTETQRKSIEGFLSHFSHSSGILKVNLDSDDPNVKERFLMIWNILLPLYEDFNRSLESKGIAYEGMVYRSLAERLSTSSAQDTLTEIYPEVESVVFVGLNALNECEKTLLRKLRDASIAEFCWDYSGELIRDKQNKSSFFLEENIREFKQAADWDPQPLPIPEINVIGVPSAVGQAKRLHEILKENWEDCAVVLPDEGLLTPVLNSIPEHIHDINVTMGVPMSSSQFFAMMNIITSIQLHTVCRNGKWAFYHKQVWELFSNEVFRAAVDEKTAEVIKLVKSKAAYYIPQEDLSGTPLLDVIFKVSVSDQKKADSCQIREFATYLQNVVLNVAPAIADSPELALELEFAKEYYRSINLLMNNELQILPLTYVKLLTMLLSSVAVPFRGEPLKGLQIMGPLETRALDFSNLVIMSADEGIFPHRSVSSSFIPPELRRGFGLPTYEYQDAVWAYYFYRMISRAKKVWMLVDTRTEGLVSGEESRYIKQLEYHFGVPVNRYSVQFGEMKTAEVAGITKTQDDVDRIRKMSLSASSLRNYLDCPAKFYYASVQRLRLEDEVAESLDAAMIGTIFHAIMFEIYAAAFDGSVNRTEDGKAWVGMLETPYKVSRQYIEKCYDDEDGVRQKVMTMIAESMKTDQVSGRNLVIADVIVQYVRMTLERDMEYLDENSACNLLIYGLEVPVDTWLSDQRIKGNIDRVDAVREGEIRVVDYKTGKVTVNDYEIDDTNFETIAADIFAPDNEERPGIAFQFYIYDLLLRKNGHDEGRQVKNSVYSMAMIFKTQPQTRNLNENFYRTMTSSLEGLLAQMYDLEVPFRRTEVEKSCSYCDFRNICGK